MIIDESETLLEIYYSKDEKAQTDGTRNRNKFIKEGGNSKNISNKVFFKYKRKRLDKFNERRIAHWLDILKSIMKRIQFPSLWFFTDKTADLIMHTDMLVD